MSNEQQLAEINATLRPDPEVAGGGKIGIFLPGQNGDLITATSILHHRHSMFPGKQIIWFANAPNADALRYGPVSEVRPWPWAGNGLPAGTPDFYPLLCNTENRLNLGMASRFELTADLEDGYFPAPWMVAVENRHNVDYPNVSKKVFKVPDGNQWWPCLHFSAQETEVAAAFIASLPPDRKNILLETFAGSGQSILDESMVTGFMNRCNEKWGQCNFIFASHKFLHSYPEFPEGFFDLPNVYSCARFTVRQCAQIARHCQLMLSVSSGIACAVSCLTGPPPMLQFCGSWICSTKSLNSGVFELVTADLRTLEDAKTEFYQKLEKLLMQYQ